MQEHCEDLPSLQSQFNLAILCGDVIHADHSHNSTGVLLGGLMSALG